MSAAREVEPASARGEVRPEGRVRARAGAATRNGSVRDEDQRGARSARRRANTRRTTLDITISRRRDDEAV